MNLDQLGRKLIAAARASAPADRVPLAFEKRILARLRETPSLDLSALWARALWRAAAPCVALTLLLGTWSFIGANNESTEVDEFSQHFEQTMFAAVDETGEVW